MGYFENTSGSISVWYVFWILFITLSVPLSMILLNAGFISDQYRDFTCSDFFKTKNNLYKISFFFQSLAVLIKYVDIFWAVFELTSSKMGSYPARSAYEDSGIDFFFLHLSDIIWAMFNCIDFCVFLYTYVFCLKTVWAVYHHYYDISFFANSNNIRTSQQNYRILGSLQQSEKCARTQS